jgi:hypothetical protein
MFAALAADAGRRYINASFPENSAFREREGQGGLWPVNSSITCKD